MDIKMYDLFTEWKQRVNDRQRASHALAARYNKYHYGIGIFATTFTAIAGAVLLTEVNEPWIKFTAGTAGLIAAILFAFQTFYSHSKRAEKHRFEIYQLVNIRRDIELLEKFIPENSPEKEQRIREIDERIMKIEGDTGETEELVSFKYWPWMLLGFTGALSLLLVLAVGWGWFEQTPTAQEMEINWVRESVQQGTEFWELDTGDPLLQKRIILVNTWINEMTTQKVVTSLAYLNERDNETPITIYLSSTGGYSKDAYAISSAIQESSALVNTTAMGDCFSACAMILTSGTGTRAVAPHSRIAIHIHSYPISVDPYSENSIRYEREKEFFETFSDIPLEWINREENFYYLSPAQAVEFQVVDGILE